MNEFNLITAFQWIGTLIITLGGTSAVVFSLAKFFGDFFANKLLAGSKAKYDQELEGIKSNYSTSLEADKAKYQRELEGLKSEYQGELEERKTELEKSKSIFFRYSEHQFSLYNDLWKSLCDLKHIGEELWEKATVQKLKQFSKQLSVTRLSVEKSALLIEDEHFQELTAILYAFGSFHVGKLRLIELRNRSTDNLQQYGVSDDEIRYIIQQNGEIKIAFEQLINKLSKSFKQQLKGEQLIVHQSQGATNNNAN